MSRDNYRLGLALLLFIVGAFIQAILSYFDMRNSEEIVKVHEIQKFYSSHVSTSKDTHKGDEAINLTAETCLSEIVLEKIGKLTPLELVLLPEEFERTTELYNVLLTPKVSVKSVALRHPYRYLILAGSDDKIEPLDPVIAGSKLIGLIEKVRKGYSIFETLNSPNISISVSILEGCRLKGFGVIRGTGRGIQVELFEPKQLLREGAILVTSGKGILPAGLVIGQLKTERGKWCLDFEFQRSVVTVLYKRISFYRLPREYRQMVEK